VSPVSPVIDVAGQPVSRLETILGRVLRVGVTVSSLCLAVGLALSLAPGMANAARVLLHAGIIVLLATPAARVVASIGEYVVERDWVFVSLTAIVLAELLASLLAAVYGRRL
jgi:uncharacterized membrane protein